MNKIYFHNSDNVDLGIKKGGKSYFFYNYFFPVKYDFKKKPPRVNLFYKI